jgi:hypothetical protein
MSGRTRKAARLAITRASATDRPSSQCFKSSRLLISGAIVQSINERDDNAPVQDGGARLAACE